MRKLLNATAIKHKDKGLNIFKLHQNIKGTSFEVPNKQILKNTYSVNTTILLYSTHEKLS